MGISRQVVYEWEDDFVEELGIDFEYMDSYQKHPIARLMRKIGIKKPIAWKKKKDIRLFFAMNIDLLRLLTWYVPNIIPIVLDITLQEIDEFYMLTKKLPICYVTSLQIRNIIKEKYPQCNVEYIPQMVSKRYSESDYKKNIDFIQFGRRNPVLHNWAIRYCDENRDTTYMYRHTIAQHGMVMYKNGQKQEFGEIKTRSEFIELLQRSKISLCSSPLADKTRDFGEGIDFLTARWFESVACDCPIMARWTESAEPEVEITGVNKIATNLKTYEEFDTYANRCLLGNTEFKTNRMHFIDQNNAAERAKCINETVSKYCSEGK